RGGVVTGQLQVLQGALPLPRRGEVPPEYRRGLFEAALRRRFERPGGPAAQTAVSSERENSAPSTEAARTASRAAGLSRSTREWTRRSSTWGTPGSAFAPTRHP